MLGEDVPAGEVTDHGLAGDRTHAVIDTVSGVIASAKDPRRWQRLLGFTAQRGSASAAPSTVSITFPGGARVSGTDPGIDSLLSEVLGRSVTLSAQPPPVAELKRLDPEDLLAAAPDPDPGAGSSLATVQIGASVPAGRFFDFAALHLITTATLDRIGQFHPGGAVAAARYRPNIIIDTPLSPGFAENDWAGRTLHIGDHLTANVLIPTPRCAIPTLAHGRLPRDLAALRILADHNRVPVDGFGTPACAGAYGQVRQSGPIELGDPVWIT
jgi:uncharacterized protein YcbX